MKLIDALSIGRRALVDGPAFRVALVTGFSPLHLETFLRAELRLAFPAHAVEITTGTYGDVPGTLTTLKGKQLDGIALALEWGDVDPRLGLRQLGGWGGAAVEDLLAQSKIRLSMIQVLLEDLSRAVPIAVSLPALPIPPFFTTAGWQASEEELEVRQQVIAFASAIGHCSRVRLISEQRLNVISAFSERLDAKSLWTAGFPYQLPHASTVAQLLARLLQDPVAKKGLITDLDNTLWRGIVGEVGPDGIHWDLDNHSHAHGLYQQFLRKLADEGILLAAASKNDPPVVAEAFRRGDMLLDADSIFPFEVSWGSKANSVSAILARWNVGPDSVVFVDDDPLELAEVQARHPLVTSLQFPTHDPQGVLALLTELRDLFGKRSVSNEDKLRLQSIRASAAIQATSGQADGFSEALLERAEAQLIFTLNRNSEDTRARELINKTNQFNLNGRRFTEGEWQNHLSHPETFLLTATYTDRFGSLGKIAILSGRRDDSILRVESWVMSCRAFARRIEHQCLRYLYSKFAAVTAITFDYVETPRNGPLRAFLSEVAGMNPGAPVELSRDAFEAACPRLSHHVVEAATECLKPRNA